MVYTKALKSFEQNANKLKDKVMHKIYKEFDKLHLKITQHLDANYEGSLDESYADTMHEIYQEHHLLNLMKQKMR